MERRPLPSAWHELLRTASAVRASPPPENMGSGDAGRLRSAIRPIAMTAAIVTAAGLAILHLAGTTGVASANGGEDHSCSP